MTDRLLHPNTVAVCAGRPDPVPGGPLNAPMVPASALRPGGLSGYARGGHPGWEPLEAALGRLDDGYATVFSSGMAAVEAILRELPRGAAIVAPVVMYMHAREALEERQAAGDISVIWVDISDTTAVMAATAHADAIWIESPTNPLLDVADLPALCALGRNRELLCVVDATLATALRIHPLRWGADLVLHSATKSIGGHSDLLLGAAIARDAETARRLVRTREMTGATPGTLESFLALRGLRTMPVRLARAETSAADLARRLVDHPDVIEVRYPGLQQDRWHERAAATMDGFGTMLTLRVTGGAQRADNFVQSLRVVTHATSFGAVESTVERRARYPAERGLVPDDLLRLSVGCEHPDDLWHDLEQGLAGSAEIATAVPTAPS